MANDGTITFSVWLDADEAEKGLKDIKKKVHDLEMELAEQKGAQSDLEEKLKQIGVEADKAKAKLEEMRRAGASSAALKEQQGVVAAWDKDFAAADAALQKQDAQIAKTTRKIERQKQEFALVQQQATAAGAAGASAASKVSARLAALKTGLSSIGKRIATLAASALVFTVLARGFAKLRKYTGKALATNEAFTAATARLKGAFLTTFQPIYTAVLPAVTALINVLSAALTMIARFSSMLFGTTADASAQAAENLYDEANALDAVGGGAKKAGKSLASFDEINQLSSSSGGGGGGGAAAGAGKNAPDFAGAVKDQIGELEIYLSGALLGLGAILAFSGVNIPLGIGLMAVGALGLASAIAENWNEMPDNIRKALTRVALILGGAAFAIGAILTLSGAHMALGIALMAIGAASLASAAALNWNSVSAALKGPLGNIVALASGALLALGLILTISGAALPLGIALIAAGGAGLVTATALNWDEVTGFVKDNLDSIMLLAGAALLAIGLVLALSGINLPLGIALIAAGAASWAGAAALNWESIKTALRGPLGGIVAIAGAALLALGVILAFSGVGLPLGIALIAAGAAGLVTVSALNWDAVLDKLKGAWKNITSWWNTNIAPVFTKEWWANTFAVIGDGMKSALNAVLGAVEKGVNWIIEKLNSLSFDVPTWVPSVGGKHFGLAIPQVSIPRLAAGAVIPPNREFLAVLGDQSSGTNIEAPLDTIVAAFRAVMRENGGTRQPIILQVDRRELGRIVFDAYNTESSRVGVEIGGFA